MTTATATVTVTGMTMTTGMGTATRRPKIPPLARLIPRRPRLALTLRRRRCAPSRSSPPGRARPLPTG